MLKNYTNEPLTDFTEAKNITAMKSALEVVKGQIGLNYPLIIGGEKYVTENKIKSLNPSEFNQVIGTVSSASIELAEKAIEAAEVAFRTWKNVDPATRANYLIKAAAIMRRKKYELSAWLIKEAGKTWVEADADTAEAIDFLEYYGRRMLDLSSGVPVTSVQGENNDCYYTPLGVGIIISPWNFPLAILTGMSAAAIVTGNTIVMKPASTTPVIAAKLMEIWEEINLPSGVANYLPCSGSEVGDYLVSNPKVRFINFTGSKAVGLRINRLAAEISPGQKWIKRVAVEMGGKDAIIVDKSAELDAAASGIVTSAFGFQGQKCSACSRAIIHADVYEEMIKKMVERTKALVIGDPSREDVNIGPVIDRNAYVKILQYIEIGKEEGRMLTGGEKCGEDGYFIAPVIFVDVDRNARIAQEEIFAPVLAIIKAKDFDEALDIANATEYGLTGAVYSNNREVLEKAKKEFHVGNLYLNRKCTGALVGANPFGGFNMSGTDSKAGGPDYLTLFMQLKSVTEKY